MKRPKSFVGMAASTTKNLYVAYHMGYSDEKGFYTDLDDAEDAMKKHEIEENDWCIFEVPLNTWLESGMMGSCKQCGQCKMQFMEGQTHQCRRKNKKQRVAAE